MWDGTVGFVKPTKVVFMAMFFTGPLLGSGGDCKRKVLVQFYQDSVAMGKC